MTCLVYTTMSLSMIESYRSKNFWTMNWTSSDKNHGLDKRIKNGFGGDKSKIRRKNMSHTKDEVLLVVDRLPQKVRDSLDEINRIESADRKLHYAQVYARALNDAGIITDEEYAIVLGWGMCNRP